MTSNQVTRELKSVKVVATSGISQKTGKQYNKIDIILENGLILCTYWLNNKDLYIVKNLK